MGRDRGGERAQREGREQHQADPPTLAWPRLPRIRATVPGVVTYVGDACDVCATKKKKKKKKKKKRGGGGGVL